MRRKSAATQRFERGRERDEREGPAVADAARPSPVPPAGPRDRQISEATGGIPPPPMPSSEGAETWGVPGTAPSPISLGFCARCVRGRAGRLSPAVLRGAHALRACPRPRLRGLGSGGSSAAHRGPASSPPLPRPGEIRPDVSGTPVVPTLDRVRVMTPAEPSVSGNIRATQEPRSVAGGRSRPSSGSPKTRRLHAGASGCSSRSGA
jgi:hypothetical protein